VSTGRWVALAAGAAAVGFGAWWLLRKKKPPMDEPTSTPQEVEALARAIMSEASTLPRPAQIAVGYAVIHESNRRNVTIWRLVRGTDDEWGPQGSGGRSYISSRQAPTPAIIELARRVLAGDEPDYSEGATNFDSPAAQRALLKSKAAGYVRTPEEVAANRVANGMELVLIPGVPEERFRMWRYV
jgi:hypothetical protein